METAPRSEPSSIIGLLSVGRGIGNVVCGPLSGLLLSKGSTQVGGGFGYQSEYGALIIFTGITAAMGMCGWIARQLRVF